MEQSNDEDEEDEEEAEMHMKELLDHLESVLSSLTRRMIKSDLEDFELVSMFCYYTNHIECP